MAKIRVLQHCLKQHTGETPRAIRLDTGEITMKKLLVRWVTTWMRKEETAGTFNWLYKLCVLHLLSQVVFGVLGTLH